MKNVAYFSILYFFITSKSFALTLNDISILLPLPNHQEFELSISPTFKGGRGDWLPLKRYAIIPPLLENQYNSKIYPNLRAVSIRIDPCFFEGAIPAKCQRQVRVVWQPLVKT